MSQEAAAVAPKTRRRFQFSLREMLAAVLACGALGTIASHQLDPIEKRDALGRLVIVAIGIFVTGCVVFGFASAKWRRIGTAILFLIIATCVVLEKRDLIQQRYRNRWECEMSACRSLSEFCTAEKIYRSCKNNQDRVLEYAQSLHDLYETRSGAGDIALIVKSMADAEGEPGISKPRCGYLFKVLKAQGPYAVGGSRSYMVNGRMTMGYALVAYPAVWNATGVNTFLVNNAGTIYQSDLGPTTHDQIKKMSEFDPSSAWVIEEY